PSSAPPRRPRRPVHRRNPATCVWGSAGCTPAPAPACGRCEWRTARRCRAGTPSCAWRAPACPDARAPRPSVHGPDDPAGRSQLRHHRRVDPDGTEFVRTAWGAQRLVTAGQDGFEELAVVRDERFVLLGDAAVLADRLHRAHRLAGAAVDALLGVDVKLAFALVDAVDGTFLGAGLVHHVHAGTGDDVRHDLLLSR